MIFNNLKSNVLELSRLNKTLRIYLNEWIISERHSQPLSRTSLKKDYNNFILSAAACQILRQYLDNYFYSNRFNTCNTYVFTI